MSTDDANDFIPEHLAKWRKITREYLFAPIESLGASSGPHAVSLLPDGKRFGPETAGTVVRVAGTAEKTLFQSASPSRSSRAVLLSWACRALLHLLRRATQHEENPLTALESAFFFHVSFMAKHPSVPRLILAWHSQTRDARVRSRIQGVIGHYESRLARLIGKAKRQGLVRSSIDVQTAASVFVGMIQGLVLRMNADLSRPEMLLREAATAFPVYLDGIRDTSAPVRGAVFSGARF